MTCEHERCRYVGYLAWCQDCGALRIDRNDRKANRTIDGVWQLPAMGSSRKAAWSRPIGPGLPKLDDLGVPMCSHEGCPQWHRYTGMCQVLGADAPTVCIPEVRNLAMEIGARRDADDQAYDDIVKLCGLAKTWEYPGQVVRDVADALKKRDDEIASLLRANIEIHKSLEIKRVHDLDRMRADLLEAKEQLRIAEAVRDDARAASARDLEARRESR